MIRSTREIVSDFIERIDAALHGNAADPYELMSDDVIVWVNGTTPLSGSFRGKKELRQILVATAGVRITSGQILILDCIAAGDKAGVFLGIQAQTRVGKTYNAMGDPAGCFFRVENGKISEIRFYPDTTQIETQIYGRAFVPNLKKAAAGKGERL